MLVKKKSIFGLITGILRRFSPQWQRALTLAIPNVQLQERLV